MCTFNALPLKKSLVSEKNATLYSYFETGRITIHSASKICIFMRIRFLFSHENKGHSLPLFGSLHHQECTNIHIPRTLYILLYRVLVYILEEGYRGEALLHTALQWRVKPVDRAYVVGGAMHVYSKQSTQNIRESCANP